MAEPRASTKDKAAFEQQYVNTNLAPGAPAYASDYVASLRSRLLAFGQEEWQYYSYAVLTAVFIGAHRGDHVPKLFEEAIEGVTDIGEIKNIFYRIRESITVIWPFVGIPWTVPAGLGLVSVLQRNGLEEIGAKVFREPFNAERDLEEGKAMTGRTYAKVNNPEVRELLSIGFPEMRTAMTAVTWGYNIAGANKTGLLSEHQTELLVAAVIVSGGATRQSRSHIKASIGMGNKVEVVKEVVSIATEFAKWTKNPLPNLLDVDALAKEVRN